METMGAIPIFGGIGLEVTSPEAILQVLSAFGLPGPDDCRLLPKSAVKRDRLVKASFAEHPPVLIRFHDPKFYRRPDIDSQALFRSRLHAGGVPVPALYRDRTGRFAIDVDHRGETWAVTVEEWIAGDSPRAVTPSLVSLLGSTLARMHALAGSYGPLFGHGTAMSLFAEGEEYKKNADTVRSAVEKVGGIALEKAGLFARYGVARRRLEDLWPDLPCGPVHADFAEHNVLLDETEDIKAVIDFSRSGDDVLVNEMVHALLRLPSFGDPDHDRENAGRFLRAYEEVRPLTAVERLAVPYLVTVIRPFRAKEISPIVEAADRSEVETVLRHLGRLERLAEPKRLLSF